MTISLTSLTLEERRYLLLPAGITALALEGLLLLNLKYIPIDVDFHAIGFKAGVISILYTLLLFIFIFPLSEQHPWTHWPIAGMNAVGISVLAVHFPISSSILIAALLGVIVTVSAILGGRGPAYLLIFLASIINIAFPNSAFSPQNGTWVNFLGLPAVLTMITETVVRLVGALSAQMLRLEIVNNVARRVASTIEIEEVISLVSEAIQGTLLADTYYVGILQNGKLRLELLYDEGEFFPPVELSLEDTLAGWVIGHKESLLLKNVPEDLPKLGIKLRVIGKPKPSLTWMGTPLESGGQILGLVAVASYQRNAFKTADLELLESVAKQASLAIDNANHHAEVEEQSRLDSLTKAYSHGYILERLAEEAAIASRENQPLSLIMLDIDYFKQYNDCYGHLIGDLVLINLTQTIRSHIKKKDVIGRWGGEEFAVLLVNIDGKQALKVAQRIRTSMKEISLKDREGCDIPSPTVSQGIAVYPIEVDDIEGFVHLADQRLYVAKERGRDQIEPAVDEWGDAIKIEEEKTTETVFYLD